MPNDDYILRSDALKATCENCTEHYVCNGKCDDTDRLRKIPAADVEPVRHGRWIRVKWVEDEDWQEGGYWILRCSECVMPYHSPTPYCPHCGAKMDREEGHE